MSEVNLHSTMDAQVWTKEFIRLFGHRLNDIDEGLMIGWFANAIMTGYDHAMRKQPDLSKLKEVYGRYDHMDTVLSDAQWNDDIRGQIRRELWIAVKETLREAL